MAKKLRRMQSLMGHIQKDSSIPQYYEALTVCGSDRSQVREQLYCSQDVSRC